MSKNNGVYILKTSDGAYRVREVSAIDNLWWSSKTNQKEKEMDSGQIIRYYGNCAYTYDYNEVMRWARDILKKIMGCEYGIQVIDAYKTWEQIMQEVRENNT